MIEISKITLRWLVPSVHMVLTNPQIFYIFFKKNFKK